MKMIVLCAGCDSPIVDRFLLRVLDRTWHSSCVKCVDCRCHLTDKCFSRNGQIFCKDDFFRRFGSKCGGCNQGIAPTDLVRRARDRVYHVTCFTCVICSKQLSTGDQMYFLDDQSFICREDFRLRRGSVVGSCPQSATEDGLPQSHPSIRATGGVSGDGDNDYDASFTCDKEDDASLNDDESLESNHLSSSHIISHGNITTSGPSELRNISATSLAQLDTINDSRDLDRPETVSSLPEVVSSPCLEAVNGGHIGNSVDSATSSDDSLTNNTDTERDKENNQMKEDQLSQTGTKRRGPRTTIKAKQLETLKSAFAATPKPTRHIREQLAQETGLNMRVIQVWFQNRRSKERRMKQLNAIGVARRQFYRNPRRLRGIRPGDPDFSPDANELMSQNPASVATALAYFADNNDFYSGYTGYPEFFPLHGTTASDPLAFISHPPGATVNPAIVDQVTDSNLVGLSVDGYQGRHVMMHTASSTMPGGLYLHQHQDHHQQQQQPVEQGHDPWL